ARAPAPAVRAPSPRPRSVSPARLLVVTSDTFVTLPDDGRAVTPLLLGSEADAALAREPLDVDDPADRQRVPAVLGLEGEGPVGVAAQRLVEAVGGRDRAVDREHLLALEGDLEPHPIRASHG